MPFLAVILIAILQGVTELFPVSSLGHAVILPALLGLAIDQDAPAFLPFLVVLHLGTALALVIYFWRDWSDIVRGLIAARAQGLRLLALVVVATLPAVVVGFALEKPLRHLFATPTISAAFLIANGVLLFAGERLRRRGGAPAFGADPLERLSWRGALVIGAWQCLAFLPGISRSGATLVGGLLAGLSHRGAAHFSFLIATPVILGAGLLEVPKLMRLGGGTGLSGTVLLGGVVAGITAFASTAFLMRYFRRREFQALDPFAWYCWAAGAAALAILALR